MKITNVRIKKSSLDEFLENLSSEDIDLYDKLDNLCGSGEISDKLFEILGKDEKAQERIEKFVKNNAERFKHNIFFETKLVAAQVGLNPNDWSNGLYNQDELYLLAIINACSDEIAKAAFLNAKENKEKINFVFTLESFTKIVKERTEEFQKLSNDSVKYEDMLFDFEDFCC